MFKFFTPICTGVASWKVLRLNSVLQNAWRKGQELAVHGWIYGIKDGLLHDLDLCISGPDQIPDVYRAWPDMRPPHRRR